MYRRKITPVHVDFLADRFADNCNLTAKDMAALLDDEFQITMSPETVHQAISGACYITRSHTATMTSAAHQSTRRNAVNKLLFSMENRHGKMIFYIDETKDNLWYARSYGLSKAERCAVDNNASGKSKNIHVVTCVSEHGLEY